jgi:parallel beta-helix repeat protein
VGIETFGGCTRPVITGCTVSGGAIGISVDTSPSASVTGNTLTGVKTYAVEVVSSDNAAVVGNTVEGSAVTVRGIAVNGAAASSKAVAITGNTVVGCTTYGIRSQGAAQVTVSGNTVQLTGSAGIYVAGAVYATVNGNVVDDQATTMNDGVFFDGCTWITCSGNTISGVDNNGILVFATTALTIRVFLFANAIDISGGSAISTNLSGGAALSPQSQVWGNSDGAPNQLDWLDNVKVSVGTGSPESAVTGGIGSLFLRLDGSTSTTLYVKTSGTGNTGWTAK